MESCQLTLDEMDLIETTRADGQRMVTIEGAGQQ
jgi:hypothetical protein